MISKNTMKKIHLNLENCFDFYILKLYHHQTVSVSEMIHSLKMVIYKEMKISNLYSGILFGIVRRKSVEDVQKYYKSSH